MSLASDQDARLHRYLVMTVPGDRPSVAAALLNLWDRPWSSNALRFACHALHRTLAHGIDVLEHPLRPLGEHTKYL